MLDIREEIKMLVEIKDVRDEINIILSVLHIQKTLIDHMSQENQAEYALLQNSDVEEIVETDIADFMTMDEQAKSIQDKVSSLMISPEACIGIYCVLTPLAQHLDGPQAEGC
jgi:hypothetical protein